MGWSISHPFTIASASDEDGLVLMCKSSGQWTGKLYELAQSGGYMRSEKRDVSVSIRVEGPYGMHSSNLLCYSAQRMAGGFCNMVLESFSTVLLIAGGSGISFVLAAVQELHTQAALGKSRVQLVEVIWTVQTAGMLPFLYHKRKSDSLRG